MTTRRATLADVARRAGVAASTVSVVFSGKTPVSDATRERVREAAASLGYVGPDPLAASLRRGRAGIVAIVFDEELSIAFLDPVKTQVMDGLAAAVSPLGAGLLLLRDEAAIGAGSGAKLGPSLVTAPIDAAVLVGCSPVVRETVELVQARGVPVVVIEGEVGGGIPRVELDNRAGQAAAARHLRDLGHERVAVLTLPTSIRRATGWLSAAEEAAITVEVTRARLAGVREVFPDAPAYVAAGSFISEGLAAGRAMLSDAATRPTAIVAQSDLLAAGVIRAAEELGIPVPEELSVTGFDGIEVDGLAPYRLTTVYQDARAKGGAAGEMLVDLLAGRDAPDRRLPCVFRVGDTTGPPPA